MFPDTKYDISMMKIYKNYFFQCAINNHIKIMRKLIEVFQCYHAVDNTF